MTLFSQNSVWLFQFQAWLITKWFRSYIYYCVAGWWVTHHWFCMLLLASITKHMLCNIFLKTSLRHLEDIHKLTSFFGMVWKGDEPLVNMIICGTLPLKTWAKSISCITNIIQFYLIWKIYNNYRCYGVVASPIAWCRTLWAVGSERHCNPSAIIFSSFFFLLRHASSSLPNIAIIAWIPGWNTCSRVQAINLTKVTSAQMFFFSTENKLSAWAESSLIRCYKQ